MMPMRMTWCCASPWGGRLFQAISEVLPRTESTRSAGVPRELEECLDAVGGERAALEKIVTLFLEQYPVLLTEIRAAANEGDYAAVAVAAHRLSGSLGVLAAKQALEAARRVEHLSAGGDRAAVDEAVTALDTRSRRPWGRSRRSSRRRGSRVLPEGRFDRRPCLGRSFASREAL